MNTSSAAKPPPAQMLDVITSYWVAFAVHAAARLGVADHLTRGPATSDELAAASKAHAPSLFRLLRMLAAQGIFRQREDGRFENTPLSETLRADVPASMRPFALMMLDGYNVVAWSHLLRSVQTGEESFTHVHGSPVFEYVASHPDKALEFGHAMTSISGAENPAIAAAYDYSKMSKLVDVGGGHGHLIAAILKKTPGLRGMVQDRPEVIQNASQQGPAKDPDIAGRLELVIGDFFQAVPKGADGYIMKYILHDWNDEQACRILANCRRAMTDGGRVLVVDNVIPAGNEDHWGKKLDVNMLVLTPGRERTAAEFHQLFSASGLRVQRIVPTACPLCIIEGVAA